jgi:hypothetical protein
MQHFEIPSNLSSCNHRDARQAKTTSEWDAILSVINKDPFSAHQTVQTVAGGVGLYTMHANISTHRSIKYLHDHIFI